MEFKKGQAVAYVTKRNGVETHGGGIVEAVHEGAKGKFVEINHGKGTIKVRPVNVTAK